MATMADIDAEPLAKSRKYAAQPDEAAGHEAVGGHADSMCFEGAVVWKRQQAGPRGRAEQDFLRWASGEPSCAGIVPGFIDYRDSAESAGGRWLGMTNLLHGLQAPAILDLKMGTRTYGSGTSPEKAERAMTKAAASTSLSLGVRVTGCRLRGADGIFRRAGRKHKKDIVDEAGIRALLSEFLRSEARFAFYSSSLLLAYDTERADECRVQVIDFSNCEEIAEKSQDLSGFLVGLETIARMLSDLAPLVP